ncbi:MAG: methyltransferase domain-containing protein [Anaerolineae bacterium]|jgi:phosphatidylethanolamine/phosphatidyl-N-methylethanolamine N-methyltransferase
MSELVERFSPKDEEIRELDLDRETAATKARYDRIAPFYDLMEWATERSAFQAWREDLWSRVPPGRILEVGVGTGKNMSYYPEGARVMAIDLSDRMLTQAKRRAKESSIDVDLRHMDAQDLVFPDDTFDTAVATFVFCSVPIPVRGLRELGRVVKPGGDIWLLEHVRINKPVIGPLMDVMNPVVVRLMGANINRQTVENVKRAGLEIVGVEDLRGELVKLIHARP